MKGLLSGVGGDCFARGDEMTKAEFFIRNSTNVAG